MAKSWFNQTVDETISNLKTDVENGLSIEEVRKRQEEYGLNELKAKKKKSLFIKFLEQFKDFMIIVLIISAIVSGIVGVAEGEGITDTIIILAVVLVNAIIGVAQENKAEKSLEALQKLSSHVAKVMRNGKLEVIPSKELVPGDIVILDTGDYVPADLRIIEAINLKSQEAALTGESVPVEKNSDKIDDEKIGIGDRINMLFSSSLITYGRGKAVVVETAMNTEVGKIANIINSAEEGQTPLQQKLDKLGKTLGIVALVICIAIFGIGLLYGKDVVEMFMTAVSLAVAAIPEGLPAVSTIVLAIGVQRMVKRNAIVKKLPAVETLGSATVICSDKTGTLTQNKMTVLKAYFNFNTVDVENIENTLEYDRLVNTAILCNDTKVVDEVDGRKLIGDPTETALTDLGYKFEYNAIEINNSKNRIAEVPFDSDRKLMTTINNENGVNIANTKGAVDELLRRCSRVFEDGNIREITDEDRNKILAENENMAKQALRVLGFAYKEISEIPSKVDDTTIENDLIFVGMFAMIDPPRPEVKDAVAKCKTAGIKTVMITGDHKITAIAIARELGILENDDEAILGSELEKISDEELVEKVKQYSVYARVSPEHKVRIVKAWQANGDVVAMTGDGVNDAPSLKTANIGCAMGITGTDVSKEAADIVLTDDNFATVVSAVEEGRRIYDNILKAIQFLISSNIGEIITLFMVIMATPLIAKWFNIADLSLLEALLPIHILWVNLVTDSLPALALSFEPAEKNIMNRKARKNTKQIFTKGMIWRIAYQGIMVGTLTLVAFMLGLTTKNANEPERIAIAQTMAFSVLAISQLVHSFNIKSNKRSIFRDGILNNKMLIGANVLSLILMAIVLFVPPVMNLFNVVALSTEHLIQVVILVLMPLVIVELFKLLRINTTKDEE